MPQEWPGLGDPQLSKTNTELWEMRSFVQSFVDLGHLTPIPPVYLVTRRFRSHTGTVEVDTTESIRESYIDSTFVSKFGKFDEISILKVDVEGAEWDSFGAMLYHEGMTEILKKGMIKQLLVEWHWDPDSRARNARHTLLMNR